MVWTGEGQGRAMGDMSKEPSMEEILSSIKRIIAEDGEPGASRRGHAADRSTAREQRRKAVVAGLASGGRHDDADYGEEILELTDEIPQAEEAVMAVSSVDAGAAPVSAATAGRARPAQRPVESAARRAAAPVIEPAAEEVSADEPEDMIVSVESEVAARTSLAALSSLVVRKEEAVGEATTLEGLVREMLRPMLKQWLDSNLPPLVEGMVAKEIARITGRSL